MMMAREVSRNTSPHRPLTSLSVAALLLFAPVGCLKTAHVPTPVGPVVLEFTGEPEPAQMASSARVLDVAPDALAATHDFLAYFPHDGSRPTGTSLTFGDCANRISFLDAKIAELSDCLAEPLRKSVSNPIDRLRHVMLIFRSVDQPYIRRINQGDFITDGGRKWAEYELADDVFAQLQILRDALEEILRKARGGALDND
jgi:hypothetical protein